MASTVVVTEERKLITPKSLDQSTKNFFQNMTMVTESYDEEDDENWDDVASWQLDWFREYVAAYGSIYELYNPDD